ncbi:MAG: hypothetical protein RLZ98_2323 [Pseudomonadota bacterium]|jgi:hypothetical protein
MNTIQNTMSTALSLALVLLIFSATVLTFMFPFVIAATPGDPQGLAGVGTVWLLGSAGFLATILAIGR